MSTGRYGDLWTSAAANAVDPDGAVNHPIQSIHAGGSLMLLAVGHSRFISGNVDFLITIIPVCMKNDGLVIGEF